MQLSQGLCRAAQIFSDQPSTLFGGRRRTWAETMTRVTRLAAGLVSMGVRPADRVALIGLNSDHYVEAVHAVLWAGGVLVPANTRWAPGEHAYALKDSEPVLVIVDEHFVELARKLPDHDPARTVYLGEGGPADMRSSEALIAEHEPIADRCSRDDALALIMYTGGTTGWPKGVMLSHANVISAYTACMLMVSAPRKMIALQAAPMFHLAGMSWMLSNISLGATLVIIPGFEPKAVIAAIADEGVNSALLVPTMVDMLDRQLQACPADMSSLQYLLYGAAPISESLLRRAMITFPNVRFHQGYGQTEMGGGPVVLGPEFHVVEGAGARLLRAAGRPGPGIDVRIVDAEMNEVPRGRTGEIVTRGSNVMLGYWNKPELTAETIVDGWLRSGDAGYMDGEGFIFIVDRLKDMIVSGGENVFSAEVENALAQHPAILECAVVGVPDSRWGEAVHAIVRLRPGQDADEAELQRHCGELIANYKRPRSYTFRDEPLPLSAAGKVLKAELRKPYWDTQALAG